MDWPRCMKNAFNQQIEYSSKTSNKRKDFIDIKAYIRNSPLTCYFKMIFF